MNDIVHGKRHQGPRGRVTISRCAYACMHRDISAFSRDIIERRIQMSPELLGFPCSPRLSCSVYPTGWSSPGRLALRSTHHPHSPFSIRTVALWRASYPGPVFRRTIETQSIDSIKCPRRDDCHRKSQCSFASFSPPPFFFTFFLRVCNSCACACAYVYAPESPVRFESLSELRNR